MRISIDNKKILLFIYFLSIYLQISIVHYLCIGVYLVLSINEGFKKNKNHINSYYAIWLFVFIVLCFASAVWSNYPVATINYSKGMLEFLFVGPFLFQYYLTDDNPESIIKILAYSGLIFVLVLFAQVPISQWGRRLATSHYAANSNAVKLMQSSICAFILWKSNRKQKHMLLLWAIMLLGVVLTGSRTMLLGAIVGVFIILLLDIDNKHFFKPILIILIGILLLYIAYNFIMTNRILYNAIGYRTELLINSILGTGRTYRSDMVRRQLIQEGLDLFHQKPIFGWGSFMFKLESESGVYYSHNNYVDLLADFGIIGTVFYYSFFLRYLLSAIRIRKYNRSIMLSLGISLIITYFVIDFGTVNWYREYTHIIYTIIAFIVEREGRRLNCSENIIANSQFDK